MGGLAEGLRPEVVIIGTHCLERVWSDAWGAVRKLRPIVIEGAGVLGLGSLGLRVFCVQGIM